MGSRTACIAFSIGFVALSTVGYAGGQVRYPFAIIDLGSLGGGEATAYGINNRGDVTGLAHLPKHSYQTFVWERGVIQDRGTLGGPFSIGDDITDSGVVVGTADLDSGFGHAVIWYADGSTLDLGTLGGDESRAYAANDFGQVVGASQREPGGVTQYPFYWDSVEGLVQLGSLGLESGWAYDINRDGQICGRSATLGGNIRGFVLPRFDGNMVPIVPFGGENRNSIAYGLNDLGVVTGLAETSSFHDHAFLWDNGVMLDIHGDASWDDSIGYGVNNLSEVVGLVDVGGGNLKAMYWDNLVGMILLNSVLPPNSKWDLYSARDINDAGQIVGNGYHNGGRQFEFDAFLATPVSCSFTLEVSLPSQAGAINTLTATGLDEGQQVYFMYSSEGGGTIIPSCDILEAALQIENAQYGAVAVANAQGVATVEVFVPRAARGREFVLQAVDPSNCQISDLVVVAFE